MYSCIDIEIDIEISISKKFYITRYTFDYTCFFLEKLDTDASVRMQFLSSPLLIVDGISKGLLFSDNRYFRLSNTKFHKMSCPVSLLLKR